MNIEEIRAYCLNFHDTTESFPFDEDVLVFKVSGKIFCLTSLSEPDRMNLKCDPEKAIELREQYVDIVPGYHMNKVHWNTLMLNGGLPDKLTAELIDHSYDLVVNKLPKAAKQRLRILHERLAWLK